jgi:hypothetical protein
LATPEGGPLRGRAPSAAEALLPAAVRLAAGALTAEMAVRVLPLGPWSGPHPSFLDLFVRWDAHWYVAIAEGGYRARKAAAFFPGYPFLERILTGGVVPTGDVGVVLSWCCLLAATWLLTRLWQRYLPAADVRHALLLLLWNPASVFLLAAYGESLLLLLAAGAFLLYAEGRPGFAFSLAGMAAAVRPTGVLVAPALLFDRYLTGRRRAAETLLFLALGEWGLLAYMTFLGVRFHDPLAFLGAERFWHRQPTLPFWSVFVSLAPLLLPHHVDGNIYAAYLIDDVVGLLALLAVIALLLRPKLRDGMPPGWLAFLLLGLLASVTSAPGGSAPESVARLLMVLFPLYPLLARLFGSRGVLSVLLPASVLLATLGAILFNLGYWFT